MGEMIIGRISKGTKMDQIYLSKNRTGMPVGGYVVITSIEKQIDKEKTMKNLNPYFYGASKIEPIKMKIVKEIFLATKNADNVIITGSFLEKGFKFNDIDVLIINNTKPNTAMISKKLGDIGVKIHYIALTREELIAGLATDPLYNLMLSKCISKKRLIFNIKRTIQPKFLDLNLLKSKTLVDNFSFLNGNEKYYFTLNMISILLFIKGEKISKDKVDKKITTILGISPEKIKENLVDKSFLTKFKKIYNETLSLIMKEMKNE